MNVSHLGAIAVAIATMPISSNAAQDQSVTPIRLQIAVQVESGALQIRATVSNTSAQPVQIEITGRKPPIDLSIWDNSGNDLHQCTYAKPIKDGKTAPGAPSRPPNVKVDLAAGGSQEYKWTVVTVCGPGDTRVPLAPGRYTVEGRLATVSYADGHYLTKLHKSEGVALTMPERR